ncbi:hypothetical protein D3C72_784950 [compost metagenome]
MQVGDHAGDGELPFEAEAQVHHDADDHDKQGHQAVVQKFLADLRPHEFHAAQFHAGVRGLQGGQHAFALGGRRLAFLQRQADHDVVRGAEVLHLEVGVAQLGDHAAHVFKLRRLGVVDFHDRAAGEFDRQVKAARDDEEDRQDERDETDDVQHQCVAHERDGAVNTEEFHFSPSVLFYGGWLCATRLIVSLPSVSRLRRWRSW